MLRSKIRMEGSILTVGPARRSLAAWAALAEIVVVFSFVFTLFLAVASVYLPYLLLTRTTAFNIQVLVLFLGGIVIAATIIWSLIPRRDRFTPSGPLLSRDEQPRLFAEIEQIAGAFREPMPSAVYLTPEVNAWVGQRGGVTGVGSHRVMGLGLPLMQVLNITQFRAVVAHEFGHFYEGDTRLGPWVYVARSAMVRTLENLGSNSTFVQIISRFGLARLVHTIVLAILIAYWKLFMRITQFVSRKQEYRADELACAVAGAAALSDGLQTVEGAAQALMGFWLTELGPSLEAGYRPPIADGFGKFIRAPQICAAMQKTVQTALDEPTVNAYDTHPPLRDRIAAMHSLGMEKKPQIADPATDLLDDLDALEQQIIHQIAPKVDIKRLKPVEWAAVGREVYLPIWKSLVSEYAPLISGLTVASLPEVLKRIPEFAPKMRDPPGMLLTREQRVQRASNLAWMAFALALVSDGWEVQSEPGQFCLKRGDQRVNPIESFGQLQSGKKDANAWREWTESLGVAQIPLAAE
jgi:heat shock protein HtpX